MRWIDRLDSRQRVLGVIAITAVIVLTIGVVVATNDSRDRRAGADEPTDSPATSSTNRGAELVDRSDHTATSTTSTTSTISVTTTSAPVSTTPSSSIRTAGSTSTTTTIDPTLLLPTLSEGDEGPEVVTLQRMLLNVTGARITPDGFYGPGTTEAVRNFQIVVELPPTGDADHDTRQVLRFLDGSRSTALPAWPVPSLGDGGADGCQVTVVGDSLMAGSGALHERALRTIGCAAAVDGVGGRSLSSGWQCRVVQPGGRAPMLLLPEPEPGNDTCAPSGLTLLEHWHRANALGDVVVVALGTNDAGLYAESKWVAHWNEALRLTGSRPVIFVTTKARPGSARTGQQDAYSTAVRRWCDAQPRCRLADWARTPAANDPGNYADSVHLRSAGTQARADFIAAAVRAVFAGDPLPAPQPVPTGTTPGATPSTTTSTSSTLPDAISSTTTSSTTTTSTTTTVAPTVSTTVSTTTSTTMASTTSTTTSTTTSVAPTTSTISTSTTTSTRGPGSTATSLG